MPSCLPGNCSACRAVACTQGMPNNKGACPMRLSGSRKSARGSRLTGSRLTGLPGSLAFQAGPAKWGAQETQGTRNRREPGDAGNQETQGTGRRNGGSRGAGTLAGSHAIFAGRSCTAVWGGDDRLMGFSDALSTARPANLPPAFLPVCPGFSIDFRADIAFSALRSGRCPGRIRLAREPDRRGDDRSHPHVWNHAWGLLHADRQ